MNRYILVALILGVSHLSATLDGGVLPASAGHSKVQAAQDLSIKEIRSFYEEGVKKCDFENAAIYASALAREDASGSFSSYIYAEDSNLVRILEDPGFPEEKLLLLMKDFLERKHQHESFNPETSSQLELRASSIPAAGKEVAPCKSKVFSSVEDSDDAISNFSEEAISEASTNPVVKRLVKIDKGIIDFVCELLEGKITPLELPYYQALYSGVSEEELSKVKDSIQGVATRTFIIPTLWKGQLKKESIDDVKAILGRLQATRQLKLDAKEKKPGYATATYISSPNFNKEKDDKTRSMLHSLKDMKASGDTQ